jgi:transcription elongation factor Elf1
MEIEHFFTCPHCWQTISMVLDLSVEEQEYIEDCEVCCNPVKINYTVENDEIATFAAESIEQ